MNNFQRLYEKTIKEKGDFSKHKLQVKKSIEHNKMFMRFVGDVFELYMPRVVQFMISSLENDRLNKSKKKI